MGLRRSRLDQRRQNKLLESFVLGATARGAADLVGVQPNSAALFYRKVRQVIAIRLERVFPERGEFEVDESYFGGWRKGKRGRAAGGKVPVFGILKRGGKVYTQMIDNARSQTLLPILKARVMPDSIVYSDAFASYDVLDVSGFKHKRVNHSKTFVNQRGYHINGIENFWSQAKRHLRRYNGIPKKHFHLFLKECEFRFNYGSPKQQLVTLKRWCSL